MEREILSQVMDMVVMDMEDPMEVMVDTEAMAMVVMVMESNEQNLRNKIQSTEKPLYFFQQNSYYF